MFFHIDKVPCAAIPPVPVSVLQGSWQGAWQKAWQRASLGQSASFITFFAAILLFSWPQLGQAFPVEEWERFDEDVGQKAKLVKIQPGLPWTEPLSGMQLLWVPGGCFKMGSPPSAEGRDADEGPVHPVCLSGFWMGKKEVNQGEWQQITQKNPATFRLNNTFPIESVSRMEVESFTSKLNSYYKGRVVFNLPTEAQWEYACRSGGQKTILPGYNQADQLAWYKTNSMGSTQSTGTRAGNRLGLLDMGGNVWEWVQDTYVNSAYRQPERLRGHAVRDPVITGTSSFSVVRGGGWNDSVNTLRCSNRGFERFSHRRSDLGVRMAVQVDLNVEERQVQEERGVIPF